MKPVRLLRALLVTLTTTTALVALPGAPAHACSCVGGDTRDFVDWADLVVVGTVTAHAPDVGGLFGGDGTATYTVAVDRVYEGSATATTEVESAGSGSACGLEGVEVGSRYVLFATRQEDGGHLTGLCSGTAPASDRLVGQVEAVLGGGQPPSPGVTVVPGEAWGRLALWFGRILGPLLD